MNGTRIVLFLTLVVVAIAVATEEDNEITRDKPGRRCYIVRNLRFCRGRNVRTSAEFAHKGDMCKCIRFGLGMCKASSGTTTTAIPTTTEVPVVTTIAPSSTAAPSTPLEPVPTTVPVVTEGLSTENVVVDTEEPSGLQD